MLEYENNLAFKYNTSNRSLCVDVMQRNNTNILLNYNLKIH